MSDNVKAVTGVLLGTASSEARAADIVDRFQSCPYVSLYASSGRTVVGVFGIPESKRWWLEWPETQPEVVGLDTAAVFLADRLIAPSPWTGDEVVACDSAPCGADCGDCPEYRGRCSGCPSTSASAGRS